MKTKFYLILKYYTHTIQQIVGIGLLGIVLILSVNAQHSPWSQKSDMENERKFSAVSAVGDKIYVIGGRNDNLPNEADNLVTEYDPATDTWKTKTPMPTARSSLAAAVAEGIIYVIGGVVGHGVPALTTVEVYDPATDTWDITKTPMPTPRHGLGTCMVDGKIYAIGGMTSGASFWMGIHDTVEIYDPVTDSWSTGSSMPTERLWFSTSVVEGKIYVIGGILLNKEVVSTVEMYDPVTDTWTTRSPMPTPKAGHVASVVDGIIYVIGGGSFETGKEGYTLVEAFDPATDTWTTMADMPGKRVWACAETIDNKVYVIGGIPKFPNTYDPGEKTVFAYDPSKDLTALVNNVNLNKCYVTPGSGSICITAKMNDPAGVTLSAMIESSDQTCTDSLQLFDDGNHNDGNAGDSIYSNTWQAGPEEKLYYVDLKVKRTSSEIIIHRMNKMAAFTTIGPVAYENHAFGSSPMPGESVKLELTLTNEGLITTATGVRAKITSIDPLVTETTGYNVSFFDISPGESKTKSGYKIEISESCPEHTEISFAIDITSEGYLFWRDTFSIITGVQTAIDQKENMLQQPAIIKNHPNPFSQSTELRFTLPESGFVTLKIYDSFGREVRILVNESLSAGEHSVYFHAGDLADGIYFCRLRKGDMILTGKMLLMR